MVSRREVSLWVTFLAAGSSLLWTRRAEAITIDFISSLIQSAGALIKSIADGIEAAYKTGAFIVDDQKAREARASLEQVESLNNTLIVSQAPLIWLINNYSLDSKNWPQLQDGLTRLAIIIQSASKLLVDLAPKLPPALSAEISQLASLYTGRASLASEIMSLPEPKSQPDLVALKNLGHQWGILHDQLVRLNTVLGNALPISGAK